MQSTAMQKALAEIERLGTREIDLIRAANIRLAARTKRRVKVNEFMAGDGYWPLMRWLADYPAPRAFLSIDEARTWLRKEIARIASLKAHGHWAYRDNAHRLPGLRDRFIVATYFARFGAEVWAREAV